MNGRKVNFDQPTRYRIQVRGRLPEHSAAWFEGFSVLTKTDEDGLLTSTLIGFIQDQSALQGVLRRIHDLGIALLLVQQLPDDSDQDTEIEQGSKGD